MGAISISAWGYMITPKAIGPYNQHWSSLWHKEYQEYIHVINDTIALRQITYIPAKV